MKPFQLNCSRRTLEQLLQGYFEVPRNLGSLLSTKFESRGYAIIPVTLPSKGRVNLHTRTLNPNLVEIELEWERGSNDETSITAFNNLFSYLASQVGNKPQSHSPGRPRKPINEWARQEVYIKQRDPRQVRLEWEQKLDDSDDHLADLDSSWYSLLKLPPKPNEE